MCVFSFFLISLLIVNDHRDIVFGFYAKMNNFSFFLPSRFDRINQDLDEVNYFTHALIKKSPVIQNILCTPCRRISILYSTLVVTAKPRKRCLAQAWNQAASVPDTQCSPLKNKWSVMSGGHQEPCPGCIHRIAVYRLAERTVEWLAGRPVGVSGAKVK